MSQDAPPPTAPMNAGPAGPAEATGTPRPPRGRRVALRLALVAGGLAGGLAAVELGFRILLFSDWEWARKRGAALRQPQNFADDLEDAYWQFQRRTATRRGGGPEAPGYDERLGWVGHSVRPGTYEHAQEQALGDERPVLLYGDSFAQCATKKPDCWEGLLHRSKRGQELAMLNYGVGGYGLDQIHLMLEASLDRFADRDPVVIVSLLVDDDMKRAGLSFRSWPKPRFRLEGGALVEPTPVAPSAEAFLEQNPMPVRSFAWRYLVHGTSLLPGNLRVRLSGVAERRAEVAAIGEALLRESHELLEARGIEHFFLLFHAQATLKLEQPGWQEATCIRTLEELGAPYVSSRRAILDELRRSGRPMRELFILEGPGKSHYNEPGNQVVFRALLEGLRGVYEPPSDAPVRELESAELGGPTPRLEFALDPAADRTRFDATAVRTSGEDVQLVRVLVDGEEQQLELLVPGKPVGLSADLRGKRTLVLEVQGAGRVLLNAPRVQ